MTDYIGAYADPKSPYHREASRLANQFETDAYVVDGVPYWKSNNSVPPTEILLFWQFLDKPMDLAKSLKTRDEQLDKFFAEYRRNRANHKPSAEEQFEMRAAFGPDAEVVDIISGRRYRT